MNKFQKYINAHIFHRNNELTGQYLTTDKNCLMTFITNLIHDLSHSEAEILKLTRLNSDASNYARNVINSGNASYVEWLKEQTKKDLQK